MGAARAHKLAGVGLQGLLLAPPLALERAVAPRRPVKRAADEGGVRQEDALSICLQQLPTSASGPRCNSAGLNGKQAARATAHVHERMRDAVLWGKPRQTC